jgi:hypothetical protein
MVFRRGTEVQNCPKTQATTLKKTKIASFQGGEK